LLKTLFVVVALCALSVSTASAAGLSKYYVNKSLDFLYRGQTFTAPSVICVALTTAVPTAGQTGATIAEADYVGYARAHIDPGDSTWEGTGGETSGVSNGTSGSVKNHASVTVGSAPASGPTTIVGFALLDSCTIGAGNMLAFAALTNSKTVNVGDSATVFPALSLVVHLQ